MPRIRTDVLLFIGLVACMRCGGRVMDEAVVGPPDGGRSSGTFSTGTGRGSSGPTTTGPSGSTTTGITSGVTTTGPDTSATTTSTTFSTTSTSTGFGGAGPTTTTSTGFGGTGFAGSGFGGAGGRPTILCTSAPIPGSDQQINCRKVVGDNRWDCACGVKGTWNYCSTTTDFPCGFANCCGFDTSSSVGCASTPVTLPPISGCVGGGRGAQLVCAHVSQLNNPGYGPFTSCCPPNVPFSCPTGTPNTCFATATEARNNCKEYCVQCVRPMP
jgi:hypothetical protein